MPLLPPLPPVPTPPPGPGLFALVAGLATPAALVYESSSDLSAEASAQAGHALRPAINLDTTLHAPVLQTVGHRNSLMTTPYELLHAIGETIRSHGLLPDPLSWFAGHWAVVGYLWSLRPPGAPPVPLELRLSPYARQLAGRLRGSWTEAMAIGVASLFVQESLGPLESATQLLDVDRGWLQWAVAAGLVSHVTPNRRPDYLVGRTDAAENPEMMVIECKGSGSARIGGISTIARGVPQAVSVGPGALPTRRWVVGAACSRNRAGTWHPQVVEVDDPPATARDAAVLIESADRVERFAFGRLLEATGDVDLADRVLQRPSRMQRDAPPIPLDRALDDRGRGYVGRTLRVRFGTGRLDVFLGLEETIRARLTDSAPDDLRRARQLHSSDVRARRDGRGSGYATVRGADGAEVSLSAQGTLLRVELVRES